MKNLQEKRNKLAEEIRSFADNFDENGKKWADDEQRQNWEKLNSDYDATKKELDEARNAEEVANRAESIHEDQERSASSGVKPGQEDTRTFHQQTPNTNQSPVTVTDEHRALALQAWMRSANDIEITDEQREACNLAGVNPTAKSYDFRVGNCSSQSPQAWQSRGQVNCEKRAAQSVGTNSAGGYTVPDGFVNNLEVAMLRYGGPRQVATIMRTASGNALPWPTLDDTSNKGRLVAENAAVTNTAATFGDTTLNAYKYSSDSILVSQELMEDSAFNMGQVVGSILGERIGRITAQHFTTGTGTAQPNGIVTAATTGVTAASATAIAPDELFDLVHSIDPSYRSDRAGFMMHDSILLALRKLKDSNNQYLWQEGMTIGSPDRLLGFPINVNQDMASAMAINALTVLFGDLSKYVIRDVAGFRLYRLEERYRDNDQTGFVAFSRHDGELLDAGTNPVKVLKQAAV